MLVAFPSLMMFFYGTGAEVSESLFTIILIVCLSLYAVDCLWVFTNRKRRALHDLLLDTWLLRE